MKKIIGFTLLTILSTSAYAFGLNDAVDATKNVEKAAGVVNDTGLVDASKAVDTTKKVSKATKTVADVVGEAKEDDKKKEEAKKAEVTEAPATDAVTKEKTVELPAKK